MATNARGGKGTVVAVEAPSGGVSSGDGVQIGSLFGVAQHDAVSGARVEIESFAGPVYTMPGDTNLAIGVGDRLFWDDTNGWFDKTTTGQTVYAIALPSDAEAPASGATSAKVTAGTTVRVLLAGVTPAAS